MKRDLATEGATEDADWQRRVIGRSLQDARRRSLDRSERFVRAAAKVLDRNGGSLTVQEVADEAGQSLRTLYQYFASKDDLLLAVFEEAMRTYARIVREAIAGFDDPVERLAAGVIASIQMRERHHKAGRDRALARVRLQLGQADPASIASSQEPLNALFRELVAGIGDTRPDAVGVDQGAYFLASLRTALTLSMTLGSDFSGELPDAVDLSSFCLNGLGLGHDRAWHDAIAARLAG
jgi:AcrR family transcriptional regulator